MSPGEVSGGMDAVSGGSSDVGGGSGAPDTGYDLENTVAAGLDVATNLANAFAAAEASGLQAGAYSPAQLDAILGMLSEPVSENAASGKGFHSPGISYGLLDSLDKEGLGKMDIPGFGQNIEQALAAQNVHNVLNYTVPALVSMVPGYGTVSALGKGIANIHGLMTGRLTPAEVMPGLAAGLIGAKTGIPSGILEGVFQGDLGKAAGAGAQAGLGTLANSMSPFGGLAVGLSGIGPSFGKAVSDAVSGATGGAPSSSSSGLTGLLGGAGTPSQGSAPTGNTYGDTGINPDTYAVLAAIEQAAQEPTQPAWEREMVAGRYGPITNYEFGA